MISTCTYRYDIPICEGIYNKFQARWAGEGCHHLRCGDARLRATDRVGSHGPRNSGRVGLDAAVTSPQTDVFRYSSMKSS